ncbi:hypothetical protein ABZ567_20485 [Streptomyces sp. NPDC016459]|uniref:SCO4225 family membrane protein n=1 Tax=Streptomyces sp. NPDC016459 TaxID=3157190 RepID=UPI00340AD40E
MRDSHARTFVRLTFANPASLVYLGLVVTAALPLVFASVTADAGFAAVWLLLITAPTSMVLLADQDTDECVGGAISGAHPDERRAHLGTGRIGPP